MIPILFCFFIPVWHTVAVPYLISDNVRDSVERQILYNGRLWRTPNINAEGHQYFKSPEFVQGSVIIGEYTFNNIKLKYDIFNDGLLLQKRDGFILLLNKELIDSFSMTYDDGIFNFVSFNKNSDNRPDGYTNILLDSDIKIYVKYKKVIIPTQITNGLPEFRNDNSVFINKDGHYHNIDTRKDLLDLFNEYERKLMKKFIRDNLVKITAKDPDCFRRVIEYYESISNQPGK